MSQYTLTAEELAIGRWLTACLPAQYAGRVLSADQRGSVLEHPYATFKVIDDQSVQSMATIRTTSTPASGDLFVREIRETRRVLISVNVYGPTAFADLRQATMKFQDPSVVEGAKDEGLAAQSVGLIRRLPGDGNTTREDRAQADFVGQYVAALDTETPTVAAVSGTGVDDLDGRTVDINL